VLVVPAIAVLPFTVLASSLYSQEYTSHVLYTVAPDTLGTVTIGGIGQGTTLVNGVSYLTQWSGTGTPTVYSNVSGATFDYYSTPINNTVSGNLFGGLGVIQSMAGGTPHAVVIDTAQNALTDLNPPDASSSFVEAVADGEIVGRARESFYVQGHFTPAAYHALMWTGTAASMVDLTPASVPGSQYAVQASADGTDGVHQVGAANEFAAYWSGSAASYQSLGPSNLPNLSNADATALRGNQIVGFATDAAGHEHPLLWNGVTTNAIDLLPSAYYFGRAFDTNGTQQVGIADPVGTTDVGDAVVWNGSPDSYVDLTQFLASGYTGSIADAIDANGNIFGAATDPDGNTAVIEWTPVPEPSSPAVVFAAVSFIVRRRRLVLS
jgi:hypothetical protein